MSIEEFMGKFNFSQDHAFHIGVEREHFLTKDGVIVPYASKALDFISNNPWTRHGKSIEKEMLEKMVGFELSACQIETRTNPIPLNAVFDELLWQDEQLTASLKRIGLETNRYEVAPDSMPLDVYPDPTGRYQVISKAMPREVLLAACQVIGTHVHVGMPNHSTALKVYNKVIGACPDLCKMGDGSNGNRLEIYKVVANDPMPKKFSDWLGFYDAALQDGYAEDPRKCWNLIRISKHGTIEFRMFGASDSLETVMLWVRQCYELCRSAAEC